MDDTIKRVMLSHNISITELADESGVPAETIRNIYYNKVGDVKASTVLALSRALGVSVNYLLGDTDADADELELLQDYRRCRQHGKSFIKMIAAAEAELATRSADGHIIPVLKPVGKIRDGIIYNTCERAEIKTTYGEAYLGIEITTDYFEPTYCDGDIILLADRFPRPKEWAVFLMDGRAYFRQYEKVGRSYVLICQNGQGSDIILDNLEGVRCVGTCISIQR